MNAVSRFAAAALLLAQAPAWAAEGSASASTLPLVVEGGNVSAHLVEAPLGAVLEELGRRVDIEVHLPASAAARPVSASFTGLPVGQALARILEGTSHMVHHDGGGAGPGGWRVWVLSSGHAGAPATGAPRPASPDASRLAFEVRHAPHPGDRSAALVALSMLDPPQFAAVVATALTDQDQSVRETALDLVGFSPEGELLPRDAKLALLEQVARADSAPDLRVDALALLADADPERARQAALALRSDPDAELRSEVEALLESLSEQPSAEPPRKE